jgi:Spy/CpxP family protein refolding chaperone
MRKKTRKIAALLAASALAVAALAPPVSAAEHHPPKFGPHDNQCSSDANHPNCPGSH